MSEVTSPILLDSTGQTTNTKLDNINTTLGQIKNVLTTPSDAEDISYDNTSSGMTATDVQDAVDELNASLVNYKDYTVTTTSNSGVTPFSAYGEYVLPNSVDIIKVVSATIYSSISYSNPACVAINNNTRELRVWSKSAASITIRVGIKN